jgi:hypothetical protein
MRKLGKTLALFLTITFMASFFTLLTVKPANAQTIPKPSVPEFTLQYVDHSNNVPPTYGIDSYTGDNITVQEGYHIQNKSIEVIITNPPFTPFENDKVNNLAIWYDVQWKGHFGNYWQDTNRSTCLLAWNYVFVQIGNDSQLLNPNAPYTIVPIGFSGNNGTAHTHYSFFMNDVSSGEVDFQVQAFRGYYTRVEDPIVPGVPSSDLGDTPHHYVLTGISSGWSNIQTISIPDGSVTTSTLPTATPTVPELSWLVIVPLLFALFCVAVVLRHRGGAFLLR